MFFPVGTLLSLGKLITEALLLVSVFHSLAAGAPLLLTITDMCLSKSPERAAENQCRTGSPHTTCCGAPARASMQNEVRAAWGGF